MPKLPPLRAIQAFEAFGRLGSVTAAASALGVTVGAVSQQIRRTEELLGQEFVERRGKTIALTARGAQYHAELVAAFDLLRAAHDRLDRARLNRLLTISCLASLATKWIGAHLLDWQMAHPLANVRLLGNDAEPVFGVDSADFRLSYGDLGARHAHRVELFTDWVVPACSPALLARRPLAAPADILAAPLLGIEWETNQGAAPTWSAWAGLIGAPHRDQGGEVTFSLSSAAIDAAINGRGFVLAQLTMATQDIAAGRLVVPFDIRMKLAKPYYLAWDPSALDKPLGRELKSWLLLLARRQRFISTPRAD